MKKVDGFLFISKKEMREISNACTRIAESVYSKLGLRFPKLTQMIGKHDGLVVDLTANRFVVTRDNEDGFCIDFSSARGKRLIRFLMMILPERFPQFAESALFKALEELNLTGRVNTKKSKKGKRKRNKYLVPQFELSEVIAVKEGIVLKHLLLFDQEEVEQQLIVKHEDEKGRAFYTLQEDVEFIVAKDTRPESFYSDNCLYKLAQESLSMNRLAMELGKAFQIINARRKYNLNGMERIILEPMEVAVVPEMLMVDGSKGLPSWDGMSDPMVKRIFEKITIVDKADGFIDKGTKLDSLDVFSTFNTYAKSTSQQRKSSAVGFNCIESAVSFWIGTGQDHLVYAEPHMLVDENGNEYPSGEHVLNIAKAYKRIMLAASSGVKADFGRLAGFEKDIEVRTFKKEVKGNMIDYLEITNLEHDTLTIAMIPDFESNVKQKFLVSVLDHDYAFRGLKVCTNIKTETKRNCTDGQGWYASWIGEEGRKTGILNRFDAFQTRISSTIKGLLIQGDEMCEIFGADIVITKGMRKGKDISKDIKRNGFQLYVVGQRRDVPDGIWLSSQPTQLFQFTKEEVKQLIDNSITFVREIMKKNMVEELLTLFQATEESDSDLPVMDFLRIAKEVPIMDEQYLKDQVTSLGVRDLNKLLGAKIYLKNSRTRYMVTDPLAILNAARAGRFTLLPEDKVIGDYEVVLPSDKGGEFYQREGKAVSIRYPVGAIHEIPLLTAKRIPAYEDYVAKGLGQGCVFYDAFTWVVNEQSGADHDGDQAIIAPEEILVTAKERFLTKKFAGMEVLPIIDMWIRYDKEGNVIDSEEGCPDYISADTPKKKEAEEVVMNGFRVKDYKIYFDPKELDQKKRYHEFIEVFASLSREITVNTIENSMIGMIANRIMILMDLLSRTELGFTQQERESIETDALHLLVAGRWEIDRPKKMGNFMEMPLFERLFGIFDTYYLKEEEYGLSNKEKYKLLQEEKGIYRHIFYKIRRDDVIIGFELKKPQWLAAQKDEWGVNYPDSLFQKYFGTKVFENDSYSYSELALMKLCEDFSHKHSNTAKNNIVGLVQFNMEPLTEEKFNVVQQTTEKLYDTYKQKLNYLNDRRKLFVDSTINLLKEKGKLRKKKIELMTRAKKNARIRRSPYREELEMFIYAADVLKSELRKAFYVHAKELEIDPRTMVGMLYLVINNKQTPGKAYCSNDGKEIRFVASNGHVALPFEVFREEMLALLTGPVLETQFIPKDLGFTLVPSNLLEGVMAPTSMVAQPLTKTARVPGKVVGFNRHATVVVRTEEQPDGLKNVLYILNKGVDASTTKAYHKISSYIGFAPSSFPVGVYKVFICNLKFNQDGSLVTIEF